MAWPSTPDPLNLIRVMPAKGRERIVSAHALMGVLHALIRSSPLRMAENAACDRPTDIPIQR